MVTPAEAGTAFVVTSLGNDVNGIRLGAADEACTTPPEVAELAAVAVVPGGELTTGNNELRFTINT